MQSTKKAGFQTDINGLRGVAVLLVTLYHFNLGLFKGGFIGVDIFFVISGYLMTKIVCTAVEQSKFSYVGFLYRRGLRIFPALFAVVFFLLLLGSFLLPPPDLSSLGRQALQALIFNSNNFYAAQQGYFSTGIDDRWLLHTWSLSVEWQFYMIYPLIILLANTVIRAISPKKSKAYLSGFLLLLAIASFIFCITMDSEFSFFSVVSRCWQMISGGLVFMLLERRTTPLKYAYLYSYSGTFLIALSAILVKYLNLESGWPGYFALLPVFGTCLVLFSGYQKNYIFCNGLLQKIGDASYSIYLWHWPVVIALTITGVFYDEPKLAKLGGLLLSVVFGYMSYLFIEPVHGIKAATLRTGLLRLLSMGGALAGVAFIFVLSNGIAIRAKDLPALTRMQLAEVSHTYDSACENTDQATDHFCFINKDLPGDKILVIGDSHAGHLYSWFKKNSLVNTTFFVKSGCPMIIGFERVGKYENCHTFAEKAFKLAESGTYKTIIISENWTGFGNESEGICRYMGTECIPPAIDRHGMSPVTQTKQTIEHILSTGTHVVVLDATPYFNFNVPRKLWRDQYWFGKSETYFSSTDFFQKNIGYDKLFSELRSNPNFHLLSFRPKICQKDRCEIYDADSKTAIFKDQDHFNPEWIQQNGQIFLPFASVR